MVRQIEVEVEPREVALRLAFGFVDERLREDHAARLVVRMGQRQEASRPEVLGLDLFWSQGSEPVPGNVGGELDPHAALHRLAPGHRNAGYGAVGKVVADGKQVLLAFGERRLSLLKARHEGGEALGLRGNDDSSARECDGDAHDKRSDLSLENVFHGYVSFL